jgi:hypothetical protein
MSRSTKWGVVLLTLGIAIGAAGVQAYQFLVLPGFLNTGLFTLAEGDVALYNATLDDVPSAPPATVLMQLIDPAGVVVTRQAVVLAPGQSATLKWDRPGTYRGHAEFITKSSTLPSPRRRLITSLEIHLGNPFALSGSTQRMFVCSSDTGSGNGRLPDQ